MITGARDKPRIEVSVIYASQSEARFLATS